jgi:PmbA protein
MGNKQMRTELDDLLSQAVARAEARGATGADAVAIDYTEASVRVRLGDVEEIQRSHQRHLGIRVLVGQRQAISSSSDLRPEAIERLVDDTVGMARVIADDPAAGLPSTSATGATFTHLPALYDEAVDTIDMQQAVAWAKSAESEAMKDDRMTNSEGATFAFTSARRHYAASGGVGGSYRTSAFSGWVVPVASFDGGMERDYWYSTRRKLADLESPESVGRKAAELTLRRLGASQPKTATVPVVFDSRTASALIGHIASALSGYSIYRGASYLVDRLGQRIASDSVTLIDDGTLPGLMGTKPYDGEGLQTGQTAVIQDGVLQSYLFDTYSARKCGATSTGNASRAISDAPTVAPTNLHVQPGTANLEDMLEGIKSGFYVTELIGFGVNLTTGDYSQGASGLWIENGRLSHAVAEVSIAGNLLTMLQSVDCVGADLDRYRAVSSPSLRLKELVVAGA